MNQLKAMRDAGSALEITRQLAPIMERLKAGTATAEDDREFKRLKALRLSQILKS